MASLGIHGDAFASREIQAFLGMYWGYEGSMGFHSVSCIDIYRAMRIHGDVRVEGLGF